MISVVVIVTVVVVVWNHGCPLGCEIELGNGEAARCRSCRGLVVIVSVRMVMYRCASDVIQ